MSITSDIYNRSIGGTKPSTGFNLSPDTEELLKTALMEGGAVAQTAMELVHPNMGFLSFAKDKIGKGFSSVIDVLSIPSNAVAALMDPDITYREARKSNTTPSDIIFRGVDEPETTSGKVGMFGARLFTDILLDPTTYATFGTASGVLGTSKLAQIPMKAGTARMHGVMTYFTKSPTGEIIEEAVRHRSVSSEGLDVLNKFKTKMEDTLRKDTLSSFWQDKSIPGRLNSFLKKIENKSDDEIMGILNRASGAEEVVGAEYRIAKDLMDMRKMSDSDIAKLVKPMSDKAGEAVSALERADLERYAKQMSVKKAMDEQAERMVKNTLRERRADIENDAKEYMSRLIERNVKEGGVVRDKFGRIVKDSSGKAMVRNLAQEWLDRGGFKMFGYSVISGRRIRALMKVLPTLTHTDRIVQPVKEVLRTAGHLSASLVSNKYKMTGRVPDTLLKLQEKARNLQDAKVAETFSFLPKLYKKLGVTEEEDRLISSAIALDKMPMDHPDSRLSELWTMIRTEDGRKLATEISEGKHGDDVVRMWKAAAALKQQLKKNLIMMRESGFAVYKQKNYIPGILNEQHSVRNMFAKFKSSKAVNAERAEVSKFRMVDEPENIMIGTEDSLLLKKLSVAEEKNRIEKLIQNLVLKEKSKKEKYLSEIEALWDKISEKQIRSIVVGSGKAIAKVTDDAMNERAVLELIEESIPQVDRKRLLKQHVEKNYEDGQKLVSYSEPITIDDINALRDDLSFGDMDLDTVADTLIDKLSQFAVETPKKTAGTMVKPNKDQYQKLLKEMEATVLENGIKGKKAYLRGQLDESKLTEVLTKLSDEWHKNPGGLSRLLESVISKEFEMRQFLENASDIKKSLKMELEGFGLKKLDEKWIYVDKEKRLWERVRASAKEINDTLHGGEEVYTESALKATVQGSLNAIRASVSREMLDDIAKKFGVPASAAPSDFVQIGLSGLNKKDLGLEDFFKMTDGGMSVKNAEGEELFFHPTVAESVESFMRAAAEDPASDIIARSFDRLTDIWKASVTSISPSFHGRNAISNVLQHFLDIGYESLNPTNHAIAIQMMSDQHTMEKLALEVADGSMEAMGKLIEMQKKHIMTDTRGYKWTQGELVRLLQNQVVAFNPNIVGQIDVLSTSRDMAQNLIDELYETTGKKLFRETVPMTQRFRPFVIGRGVGNMIETEARLVDFIANLKRSGDVEHAATMTKEFLFDYQNLTQFEKKVLRRIIPFYTFSRKNMELQVKTLLTKPGRVASFAHVYQNVGDVFAGNALSDEERSMLPEWMKDGLNMVVARNGKTMSIVQTMGTNFEQPFDQLNNIMGSLNPIIKGPLERSTGYSFFHGKPLSEATNATAFASPLVPEAIRDFIGYTKVTYKDKQTGQERVLHVSLKPDNMHLFSWLPFTPKILSTLKTMEQQDTTAQQKTLQLLLAWRTTEIDIALESEKRERELRNELEKVLDAADLGYRFERFHLKDK